MQGEHSNKLNRDSAQIDLPHLKTWVGKKHHAQEWTNGESVKRYAATLGLELPRDGRVPAGFHWCLAPDALPAGRLAEDGHPIKGEFLPPVPLPHRMWASGALTFHHPMMVEELTTRRSEIANVEMKEGKQGKLVFVTLAHTYAQREMVCIEEEQTLVYKGSTGTAADVQWNEEEATAQHIIHPDEIMLFRYSALTFNAHRIHYDHPYATRKEGYAGLIVHGPLIASCLLGLAEKIMGTDKITRFSFRALSPAIAGEPLRLLAQENDKSLQLMAVNGKSGFCMKAEAESA